ncbi:hypothetical protein [Mucilaginibacter sp. UR6-11]|uniref:hypothetical protein n=1 Tax=Mucilaginibacter sp. UR6-11 TaxID=1435644 RepID=UPI001E602E46|nr:hypothetical protein [Mucilaginibacter sp. UR6-11]MCC8425467.1 hypothetical protein [Mucilaginibacter sp. UR6-11]
MYQELNAGKTNELSLQRRGWLFPEYTLTDNTFNYGKLSYKGLSKRNATVCLAGHEFSFNFERIFSRAILITDEKGMVTGKCTREPFTRTRILTLKSGFSARFYRPSFFSREHVWDSEGYGKLMGITNHFPFSLTTDIHLYQSQTPASIIPLMIFLGAHLIIVKRQQRAVH